MVEPCLDLRCSMLSILFVAAVAAAATAPKPKPPQPHIAAGFETYNIFWPYDEAQDGRVYACTYIPTLVLANHTRLIAHASCALDPKNCNGLHLSSGVGGVLGVGVETNPIVENRLCQKHSDDGGKTWSKLKVVSNMSQNGQILWDDVGKVLIAHWTSGVKGIPLQEHRSSDLGETWSAPRNLSFLFPEGPVGDRSNSFWASAGSAVQLSPSNKLHPNRLIFTGRMNGCGVFWFSDDSGKSYHMSKNTSGGPFCWPAIAETAIAETPDGGILSSSRNGIFHGKGKCDCRATTRSRDGGTTFGDEGYDPVLVEPECMATMVNGGQPGAIFHANPGHGTDSESKSPPNGRASGTVRRSVDGGKTWTSVVLNGDNAYSYSCLSKIDEAYVGLAWETVLPGSGVPSSWSTNNVVFTRIPQNFTMQTIV